MSVVKPTLMSTFLKSTHAKEVVCKLHAPFTCNVIPTQSNTQRRFWNQLTAMVMRDDETKRLTCDEKETRTAAQNAHRSRPNQ
mmetsp:Transcript_29092/g.46735  ORF Transcript_29092/g.46735 Transcript_29092/m.46735 type:complete len:83 (-) Transcript_29092:53-301(-)